MDEVARPNFKQHGGFRIPNAKPFDSERAKVLTKLSQEKARANRSVKEALMNAFDKLGNEAFFVQLGRGSAEDKRCLAMILAKLLPIEVQGALDASLTVKVVTMLDGGEVQSFPTDATPRLAQSPVSGHGVGRGPEDGDG